jgi:hypothetical protein
MRTLDIYEAMATAHDALDCSQTKATTRKLSREEGIKDTHERCLIHTRAVISDFQTNKMARRGIERSCISEDCFRDHPAIAGGDFNAPFGLGRYSLSRVDDQIHEDLLYLAGIAFDEQLL